MSCRTKPGCKTQDIKKRRGVAKRQNIGCKAEPQAAKRCHGKRQNMLSRENIVPTRPRGPHGHRERTAAIGTESNGTARGKQMENTGKPMEKHGTSLGDASGTLQNSFRMTWEKPRGTLQKHLGLTQEVYIEIANPHHGRVIRFHIMIFREDHSSHQSHLSYTPLEPSFLDFFRLRRSNPHSCVPRHRP